MNSDNPAAFPTFDPAFPNRIIGGMSLRDYFAAKALQGMAAGDIWSDNLRDDEPNYLPEVARIAYLMADAMLKERSK